MIQIAPMRLPALCALVVTCALSNLGCIEAMLTNGQIEATRRASGAFDTIGDYELARGAAQAGLVQFEGMHKLAPKNEDALFMLTQGWVGYGFAFAEDDMEAAADRGDDAQVDYHKKRAKMAYERGVFYGLELLSHADESFKTARKNEDTMKKWLREKFTSKSDSGNLFWTGYAWLAKTNLLRDEPEIVADLFVGVAMVERSIELDPDYMHHTGTLAMAAYHARAVIAEMDEAKRLFDSLLTVTQHKTLLVQLTYAQTYGCLKADRALYEKLLNEVLAADDPDPEQRLNNTIAKRRAKRYLGKQRMVDCGIDMSQASAPPAPAK
jgi:TRAP transporter T-component